MRGTLPYIVAVFALLVAPAYAGGLFSIEPFKAQLSPQGKGSSKVFRFTNPADEQAAIQVNMQSWHQNATTGAEENAPADKDFEVYPDQFVLAPHSTQAVRITWKGPAEVPTEQAYRLVAEQLPVDFKRTPHASAINFLLTYRAAVYIAPDEAQPKVEVTSFQHVSDTLAVTFANSGNAHALLTQPTIVLTDGTGKTTTLQGEALHALPDINLHPGGARTVALAWPAGVAEVKALRFDYKPGF